MQIRDSPVAPGIEQQVHDACCYDGNHSHQSCLIERYALQEGYDILYHIAHPHVEAVEAGTTVAAQML